MHHCIGYKICVPSYKNKIYDKSSIWLIYFILITYHNLPMLPRCKCNNINYKKLPISRDYIPVQNLLLNLDSPTKTSHN